MALWLEVVTVLDATENQEVDAGQPSPVTPAALVPGAATSRWAIRSLRERLPAPTATCEGGLIVWRKRLTMPGRDFDTPTSLCGAKVHDVVVDQFPAAVEMRADLASVAIGVNNMLRPRFDLRTSYSVSARSFPGCVGQEPTYCWSPSVTRVTPVEGAGRDREPDREYDSHLEGWLWSSTPDWWTSGEPCFDDDRLWSSDQLHLSSLGLSTRARAGWGAGPGRWVLA